MIRKVFFLLTISSFAFCCDENPQAVANLLGVAATPQAINNAVAACIAAHAQQNAYILELTTTSASLVGNTTNYIAASVVGQIQINAKLARIAELKALLGSN